MIGLRGPTARDQRGRTRNAIGAHDEPDYAVLQDVPVGLRRQVKRGDQGPLRQTAFQLHHRPICVDWLRREGRQRQPGRGCDRRSYRIEDIRRDEPGEGRARVIELRRRLVCRLGPREGGDFRSASVPPAGLESPCGCGRANRVGSRSASSSVAFVPASLRMRPGADARARSGGLSPSHKIRPSWITNTSKTRPHQRRRDQGCDAASPELMAERETENWPRVAATWPAGSRPCLLRVQAGRGEATSRS